MFVSLSAESLLCSAPTAHQVADFRHNSKESQPGLHGGPCAILGLNSHNSLLLYADDSLFTLTINQVTPQ